METNQGGVVAYHTWWHQTQELMGRVGTFLRVFLLWTLVGLVSKIIFLLVYQSLLTDVTVGSQLMTLWYGLRLDIAIAGYLTLIPGVLLIVSYWKRWHILSWIWKGYFFIIGVVASLAYVVNIGLYGYWGFPLDDTSLLYIRTSPVDAIASMELWQLAVAMIAITMIAIAIYKMMPSLPCDKITPTKNKVCLSIGLLLLNAALLLPIRGGVGTGTNHTGSVYFSENIRLNHAAVNPIFSFVEAVMHQEEIGTKYRFMRDDEATVLFNQLIGTHMRRETETIENPNVILIVLESFSDSIMHVEGVTPNLVRYMQEGLYFSNFYANSFRTDRALVSIHSGLPAQPSMSVMDMPRKSTSLPSIAGTLARKGYSTTFYYGGDINYSNMRSYFMGTGFQHVVSDVDFPMRQHTGKWGVADGPVFDRMLNDIKEDCNAQYSKPFFRSIMTSSSHEPFDVPNYHKIRDNSVHNAFSYADHCLGIFIKNLKSLPCWKNTIVAIVPDHLGAWPENVDNYQLWRYKIPFIIIGGEVEAMQCSTFGSQIDIAATLLGLIGMEHSEFLYSKDIFDNEIPHFAFFTFPDAIGMVTDSNAVVYDNTSGRIQLSYGENTDRLLKKVQAYLQKLYDDLDKR